MQTTLSLLVAFTCPHCWYLGVSEPRSIALVHSRRKSPAGVDGGPLSFYFVEGILSASVQVIARINSGGSALFRSSMRYCRLCSSMHGDRLPDPCNGRQPSIPSKNPPPLPSFRGGYAVVVKTEAVWLALIWLLTRLPLAHPSLPASTA